VRDELRGRCDRAFAVGRPLQEFDPVRYAVTNLYVGGYSQSGVDVATFASAFNGGTRMADGSAVYDGYLPAAHAASMTPLQAGGSVVPTFEFTPMAPVDVPVIDLETHAGRIPSCDGEGSSFPIASFMRGAVDLLYRWAEDGEAPPTAERIELATSDVVSAAAVDATGNPLGGVRSPFVDVPLVQYAVPSSSTWTIRRSERHA
jgi:Alpha/beta hydrolase domain